MEGTIPDGDARGGRDAEGRLPEAVERAAREVEEALAELQAAEDREALERTAIAVSRAAYRLLAAVMGRPPA